ncbi:conjugal transfer protein TrbE, partial [Acidithiobacillus caldus]|nr:conjugal transfer protein TrbE [Acidithiobacillus caldus]
RLIDMERAAQYGQEGHHFVSRYYCTIAWRTPVDAEVAVTQALVQKGEGKGAARAEADAFRDILARYKQMLEVVLGLFRSRYRVRALDADGL